jgi:hypothetical protein
MHKVKPVTRNIERTSIKSPRKAGAYFNPRAAESPEEMLFTIE